MTSRRLALLLIAAACWASNTRCSLTRPPSTGAAHKVPVSAASAAPAAAETPAGEPELPEGLFHRIERGQTLWRIARAYGVSVDDLLAANGLTDPTSLASGAMLFVPGATVLLHVPPYPAPAPSAAPPPERPLAEPPSDAGFVWPVAGGAVLSPFGAPRHGRRHAGIDIRGPLGQEIVATDAGEVVYCGSRFSGYGKMVILDHGNGLQSLYAHASELLVEVGDRVARGQAVARVGRTGNATTEHCHFELRANDVPVDPMPRYPDVERLIAAAAPRVASASKKETVPDQKRKAKPTYP